MKKGEYEFTKCATALDRNGPYYKMDVVAAAIAFDVNMGRMARALNRSRNGLQRFINAHADILTFLRDMTDTVIDDVEQNMIEAAKDGDLSAARYVLSTLGKERGWTTRLPEKGDADTSGYAEESPVEKLKKLVSGTAKRSEAKPDLTVIEGGA